MFNHISEKIVERMVKCGTVVSDDKDLYQYGVREGLTLLLNIGTTVAIGLLFGALWQLLLFTVAYIVLRRFAGGYHARTPLRCYALSTILTIIITFAIKYLQLNILICVGILVLASIVIITFSPVEDQNKPLDELENKIFGKKARKICVIEIFVAVILLLFNLFSAALCIIWAIATVSFLIAIAKILILFKRKERNTNE